jgi:hypothetical protein
MKAKFSSNYVFFKKRNGEIFVKRFKTRSSKARAMKGWRAKGGKIQSW